MFTQHYLCYNMGIVFRQSVKTTMVVVLGAVLGAVIIWLSTRFIPDKQLFGFTKTLTNQAVILSQILMMGMSNTLVVYIHKYQQEKAKVLITLTFILPLFFLGLLSIIYFLLKPWVLHHYQPDDAPLMSSFYIWLPIYTLLFLYMNMLEYYLGSQLKVAVAAFIREVVIRCLNIILLILFAFNYVNFSALVIGTVLIYVVPVIVFLIFAYRTETFGWSFNLKVFSKEEYNGMIHFSWYHFLMMFSLNLLAFLDALLIPFYDHRGLRAGAIYALAVFVISFLQMPSKALVPASYTVIAKAFADNDLPKVKDFFIRASVNMFIPTLLLALLIGCNLHNALLFIKNDYHEVLPVFLILLIGRLIDCATGMNDQILSIANFYRFNFYVSLILIGVLYGLIRVLVPLYSVNGAAWSTTITIIIFNTIKYFFVWKKMDMQPFSINTLYILLAGAIAFLPGYFIPHLENPFFDTFLRSSAIITVFLGIILWLKPSEDLKQYLMNVKKDKRLF